MDLDDMSADSRVRLIRGIHNPNNERVGHYTGRCMECHSSNLWSDMTVYGCRDCGAIYTGSSKERPSDERNGRQQR